LKPPHMLLALSDAPRAIADMTFLVLASPLLKKMPKAKSPHSVMVLPGFLGDDKGNQPLVRFLRGLGYNASGWQQGRNLGTTSFSEEALQKTMTELAEKSNGKVSLVGHSLGGIYAREIAKMAPETIHQVITLGSPFGEGQETASHAANLYRRLNPKEDQDLTDRSLLPTPPSVPTTAIYTRGDGVVNWRTSKQEGDHPHVHNVEVPGSHIGLNMNAAVWYWVAKKLHQHH
jgi:pimeloyl-ACP methyl ester carboxylesterase